MNCPQCDTEMIRSPFDGYYLCPESQDGCGMIMSAAERMNSINGISNQTDPFTMDHAVKIVAAWLNGSAFSELAQNSPCRKVLNKSYDKILERK